MREKALRLGKTSPLIGVITEPSADERGTVKRPAVILLNSGILHRVGACRLYVRTARRLAARGFTSLRFDHGGIGDSEPRRDNLAFEEAAAVEITEVMDYLQSAKGFDEFVLMGLCSGADMGFNVAIKDPRVTGLVSLDAYAYKTRGYWARHYAKRARSLTMWKRFFLIRTKRALGRLNAATTMGPGDDAEVPTYVREFPPREDVAANLGALVARGAQLLFIYSDGNGALNYAGQFRRMYAEVDFRDQAQVEYVRGADHIFTDLDHQLFVLDTVDGWAARAWGSGPDDAPADGADLARAS